MATTEDGYLVRDVSLTVAVRRQDGVDTGWVYLDEHVAYTWAETSDKTPEGLEDFTGVVVRRFAKRLSRAGGLF